MRQSPLAGTSSSSSAEQLHPAPARSGGALAAPGSRGCAAHCAHQGSVCMRPPRICSRLRRPPIWCSSPTLKGIPDLHLPVEHRPPDVQRSHPPASALPRAGRARNAKHMAPLPSALTPCTACAGLENSQPAPMNNPAGGHGCRADCTPAALPCAQRPVVRCRAAARPFSPHKGGPATPGCGLVPVCWHASGSRPLVYLPAAFL